MIARRLVLSGMMVSLAAGSVVAQGKKAETADISGRYFADGRNPDGSTYEGRVNIDQSGNDVEFTWYVSSSPTEGRGTIDGRLVTVDWGDTFPVIYVIMPDGTLQGTWADGTALEKLTPG